MTLRVPRRAGMACTLSVVLPAITFVAAPRAQQATVPQSRSFRTATTGVILDLVVRDKRGRPVRDVQPHEVTVLEDGVRCEIRSFRLIERSAPAAPADPVDARPG